MWKWRDTKSQQKAKTHSVLYSNILFKILSNFNNYIFFSLIEQTESL